MARGRIAALIDVGTCAGFGLLPDQYGYVLSDGSCFGSTNSPVEISCVLEGPLSPRGHVLPVIDERVGIDVDPIDLENAEARDWLRACVPPEVNALTRAARAVDLIRAARPAS